MPDEADILSRLRRYAILMPPTTESRIDLLNFELDQVGLPTIPREYRDLLLKANGIRCAAGFVLYGTEPMQTVDGYTGVNIFDPIYKASFKLADYCDDEEDPERKDRLVLGEATGFTTVVFNRGSRKYGLMDILPLHTLRRYESIYDFIAEWLNRRKIF